MEVIAEKDIEVVIDSVGEVSTNSALEVDVIDNTELAVSVNRKEFNIVGDELYIPKRYEDAPQWLRDLIGTVTEQSYARKITDLNNLSASLQQLIVELDVAKNTYTQSIISSNDIDERINAAITTLNSSLSGSDATIVNLISTRATPSEASAIALNTISSSINNGEIGALIGSINTTLATETKALANNIDLIHAEMSNGFEGTADAIRVTQAYVGIDETGASTGTGLLADVSILQNQIDSKVESWYTLSTNDPKTAWTDAATRAKHDGDMWYQTDTKRSYWYSSSVHNWNLIDDAKAIQALANAATAQATADGKISSYYMSTLAAANVMSNAWTATEKTNNIGDLVVVWDDSTLDNNGTWRWNGTTWVSARDKKLIALASDVTNLSTELSNGTNTWASADSKLENSLRTEITGEGARVESKFAYNSNVNINGVWKKSGFGLTTNYISGNGTQANPYISEFWIDASRLKFTNSNQTGQVAPFTIDATGVTPQITFNGKVSFSNVTDVPQLGSTPQEVVTAINNAQTTTINGPRITTGSITANQIQANSISADRLSSSNGVSTVWSGGGLVSQNFNGNPAGNIGSPTQGFRLSSNAAGTETDPNIYGAYIKGSIVDIETLSVKAVGYPGNSGRVVKYQKNGYIQMPGYGSGFLASRVCSQSDSAVKVEGWYRAATNYLVAYLQYSTDGINWNNLAVKDAQQYGYLEYFYIYFTELFNPSLVTATSQVTFRIIGNVGGSASDILISIYNN